MAQHDYNIANQTGLEFRVDLNNALQAIVTGNSGATAPSATFPGMVWRDTSSSPSVLKKRNDADDGWVTVLTAAGEAIAGAASASDQRTALGLGTASTLNVGTAANNIVQLDGTAKLPAVDGSNLTGIVPTYPTQTGNAGKFLSTNGTVASWSFPITIGTTVATTTGTSFDFTGIPATAKRITITVSGVSTNGASNIIIQLGTDSAFEVTGYTCAASNLSSGISTTNSTAGFTFIGGVSASTSLHGDMVISLHDPAANKWVERAIIGQTIANTGMSGGSKALSAPLTRIRLTTTNGTDTFDSGTINILVE